MSKKVIIVESPAKARTIANILKNEFTVLSSVGHIRDLPKTRFGVDVNNDFDPEYVTISGKKKVIENIRKECRDADQIYLAADPDREGEAICWHLSYYLENYNAPINRILYYEITPQAIRKSLENPSILDIDKVNAQQGRRILDRLVGYRLSPLLWKKVRKGLSAGRVQSVALKLICDKEKEIQAFKSEEYWILNAQLQGNTPPDFRAVFHSTNNQKVKVNCQNDAESLVSQIKENNLSVSDVSRRKVQRRSPPPFITSTLQQEAARRFRFPAKKTMRLAQSLYEGKDLGIPDLHGLITYMRTDSPRISDDAQSAAKIFITESYGENYYPEKPNIYKARKSAQEAHEAIRPTMINLTPDQASNHLKGDELKLYKLIWERFIASQMAPAELNVTTVKISAGKNGEHELRAVGSELLFPGFWKVTGNPMLNSVKEKGSDEDDNSESKEPSNQILPVLHVGEVLKCLDLKADQHFTKPPSRYSEATLVRELEAKGIGRPSTYAAIMATIRDHDYVDIKERRFFPTDLGFIVTDLLSEHFPEIMSVKFTAQMENQLDDIEKGAEDWKEILHKFYKPFAQHLQEVQEKLVPIRKKIERVEGVFCPECKGPMIVRFGKRGRFLSCEAFPECKGTLPFGENASEVENKKKGFIPTKAKCAACGAPLVLKTGRFGLFLTCSNFPKCREKGPKPTGWACPRDECEGKLVSKRAKGQRFFYGCDKYPECDYILQGVLIPSPCPECNCEFMTAISKKGKVTIQCPKCEHSEAAEVETMDNGKSDPSVPEISGS